MKNKKFNSILSSCLLGVSCVIGFTSCDSGGDSVADVIAEVQIPDVPNQANDVNEGDAFDLSGVDADLESVYKEGIFDGINAERASRGLPDLLLDAELEELAKEHNQGLIDRADVGGSIQIDHDGAQGRADIAFDDGFISYGENVAGIRGFGEPLVVTTFVQGWVDSPGHFANLTGAFTHSGVAVTVDPRDGTIYATQIFASE